MKKINKLKYNLFAWALGGVLIMKAMSYQNQTTQILEDYQEKQLELEDEINLLESENSEIIEKLDHLETTIEINKLEKITLEVLLETDVEYLKEKETLSLDDRIFYLTQEEYDVILEKISQMKKLKTITIPEDAFPVYGQGPLLTEENVVKLFETVCNLNELEVLKLTYLEYLEDISSISKLKNLRELNLFSNQIKDITPLQELENLRELNLSLNQIKDITPLQELKYLEVLALYGNSELKDITSVSSLTAIKEIDLDYTSVSNLQPLETLTNLESLSLSPAEENVVLTSIDSLSNLVNLKFLTIHEFQLDDISFLKNMSKLSFLRITKGTIKDISPLAYCPELSYIDLANNEIEDITAISNLTNLENLFLSNNHIQNIDAVSTLINLEFLWLNNNQIEDITAIKNLENLYSLTLGNNEISNVDALKELRGLHTILLHGNKIPHIDLITLLINNENADINDCFSSTDLLAYREPISIRRELKDIEQLELNHLLEYDVKYLKEYDTVWLSDSFFDCNQTEFNMVLKKLEQLPNLRKLTIIGPPSYPNYSLGIGVTETEENVEKMVETIQKIKTLEELDIEFVFLLENASFVFELPNLTHVDLSCNGIAEEVVEEIHNNINNRKHVYQK